MTLHLQPLKKRIVGQFFLERRGRAVAGVDDKILLPFAEAYHSFQRSRHVRWNALWKVCATDATLHNQITTKQ